LPPNFQIKVFNSQRETGVAAGLHLKARVDAAAMRKAKINLGLATGSSPVFAYEVLHGDDWSHVQTFNLDEYHPMKKWDQRGYRYFMYEKLFQHLKSDSRLDKRAGDPFSEAKNFHLLNAEKGVDLEREAREFEAKIRKAGGIDVQVLGIGRNGHLGFNEPPHSRFDSRTRKIKLDEKTLEDAEKDFQGGDQPTEAITMGIATIMEAKEIVLIVTGEKKAEILAQALLGPVTEDVPASILQRHPNVKIFADREATSVLEKRLAAK
jgi:glucosamine-6-phosphate deaminase